MTLNFTKMNGAGNDFVVIDNRDLSISLSGEQIERLCDRHRGIGADGLLAVEPAEGAADFKYRYYNADGGEAEMCGNGARCYGRFVKRLTNRSSNSLSFETMVGDLVAHFDGDLVEIAMSDPFDLELDLNLGMEGVGRVDVINTGVPHVVVFVEDVENTDVIRLGRAIRQHNHFAPAGTNVNFAQINSGQHLAIRTYERGVEDETLACGTGMVACALIHNLLTGNGSPIKVDVKGGDTLEIGFVPGSKNSFTDVTLKGPADFTFTGIVEI